MSAPALSAVDNQKLHFGPLDFDIQWLPFENRQSPVYVVNMHFSRKPVGQ